MKKIITKCVFVSCLMLSANAFAQCDDTNFAAWSDAREDVAGQLEAVAPGLSATACKMQVQSTADPAERARVQDDSPQCESSYRARFVFDITALGQLPSAERAKVYNAQCNTTLNGNAVACSNTGVVQFKLKGATDESSNIFRSFVIDEGVANADNRRKFDIPAGSGEQEVEIQWVRASADGVADGQFRAWWGGNTTEATPDLVYTDLENFNNCIDRTNLGLISGNASFAAGNTGLNLFFDEFESRRQTGIGVN